MKTALNEPAIQKVFESWWQDTQTKRANMARLRRLDLVEGEHGPTPDVVGALMEPSFRELCSQLQSLWPMGNYQDQRIEDLVVAVSALARIREKTAPPTAQLLGGTSDDSGKMKAGHFLSLMRADTPAQLFDHARRITALLNGKANVGELGASLLLWRTQPWVKRNWARDFYLTDLAGREVPHAPETVSQ